MGPNNPSLTVERGGWITVNILRNNHNGGFMRWSIINVRDMGSKAEHERNAFVYTCSDRYPTNCLREHGKRDCRVDGETKYLKHPLLIPKIYKDGVYVLGAVWFGGGTPNGNFGDYYDCMYIQIKGGPLESSYTPEFRPGVGTNSRHGMCQSTVGAVGICRMQPCAPNYIQSTYRVPDVFNGSRPAAIPKERFFYPHLVRRTPQTPYINSMTFFYAKRPGEKIKVMYSNYYRVYMKQAWEVSMSCDVRGDVKDVTFYVIGVQVSIDTDWPYTIAGDWVHHGVRSYAPWKFAFDNQYLMVSCRARGYDGSETWKTVAVSTIV